jgi:hypothetical protein
MGPTTQKWPGQFKYLIRLVHCTCLLSCCTALRGAAAAWGQQRKSGRGNLNVSFVSFIARACFLAAQHCEEQLLHGANNAKVAEAKARLKGFQEKVRNETIRL